MLKQNLTSTMKEEIARRIREAREWSAITQVQAAKQLGISRQTYIDMESGKTKHNIETLIELSKMYAKPVAWFYEGTYKSKKVKYIVTVEMID